MEELSGTLIKLTKKIRGDEMKKEITMDFATYLSELEREREKGFSLVKNLPEKLEKLIPALESYDREKFYQAKNDVYKILHELKGKL